MPESISERRIRFSDPKVNRLLYLVMPPSGVDHMKANPFFTMSGYFGINRNLIMGDGDPEADH